MTGNKMSVVIATVASAVILQQGADKVALWLKQATEQTEVRHIHRSVLTL